jgi:alpha 1,3-mannosyltransferase
MGPVKVGKEPMQKGQEEPVDSELFNAKYLLQNTITICAPQLLHLDLSGRPIWFNGWLLPNKFSDDLYQQPANFEAFIQEPRDVRAAESWKLEENNVCCLSSDHLSSFTLVEKSILDQTVEIARNVGAIREN